MQNLLFAPSLLIFAVSLTTGLYFILFVVRAKPTNTYTERLPDINHWKTR
jgi:hypothetical protein